MNLLKSASSLRPSNITRTSRIKVEYDTDDSRRSIRDCLFRHNSGQVSTHMRTVQLRKALAIICHGHLQATAPRNIYGIGALLRNRLVKERMVNAILEVSL